MRWLFADPNQPDEAAAVRQCVAQIDQWWQAFQDKSADLDKFFRGKKKLDVPRFMNDTLQAIDPHLMWEYGRAAQGAGRRLVITPEVERWLRPMVRTILERAPKIDDWEFYPYRQAEPAAEVVPAVKSRSGLDISGADIEANVTAERKVDLKFSFPSLTDLDEDSALQAAFVTTETLLGEQVLDNWIGEIRVVDGPADPARRALPLGEAQAAIAALIRACIEQLPTARRHQLPPDANWINVELERPEPADDFAARSDQFTAFTRDVQLLRAIHSGQPFSSSCHSRWGETFCYLKLDGQGAPPENATVGHAGIQEALQSALRGAGVGCVLGGGAGLRYAYLDLALGDIPRAAGILRQTLVQLGVPRRTWLLFNDDDYAHEWIGAYPDTPAPPGMCP